MIKISNLKKSYGNELIFNRCSLEILEQNVYGVIGVNGCGKTTFFKVLLSYTSFEGEIIIDSNVSILYIPEEITIYDYLTGWQVLQLLTDIQGFHVNDILNDVKEKASLFNYTDFGKLVCAHSKGSLRKLFLIQALSSPCELLILDEPFSGLDESSKKVLMNELSKIKKTVLFSDHSINRIEKTCDQIIRIEHGEIICSKNLKKNG